MKPTARSGKRSRGAKNDSRVPGKERPPKEEKIMLKPADKRKDRRGIVEAKVKFFGGSRIYNMRKSIMYLLSGGGASIVFFERPKNSRAADGPCRDLRTRHTGMGTPKVPARVHGVCRRSARLPLAGPTVPRSGHRFGRGCISGVPTGKTDEALFPSRGKPCRLREENFFPDRAAFRKSPPIPARSP